MKTTLKQVAETIEVAHGYCTYFPRTNETYGPNDVGNLDGPTTSSHYDCTRSWDTDIAIAMAEDYFGVDLSHHSIVDEGPWRDTVRSIHRAILAEQQAEIAYQADIAQ